MRAPPGFLSLSAKANENDNVGYGYVHIAGDRVQLLERGLGLSPWDSKKKVHPLAP